MNYYVFPGLSNSTQIRVVSGIKEIDHDFIIKKTCEALKLDFNRIFSAYRGRDYTEARFIIVGIVLMIDKEMSLKKMGKILGGRDHTTIIYCRKMYNDLEESNKEFKEKVKIVKEFCFN